MAKGVNIIENKIFYTRIGTVTEYEIKITMNYKVLRK